MCGHRCFCDGLFWLRCRLGRSCCCIFLGFYVLFRAGCWRLMIRIQESRFLCRRWGVSWRLRFGWSWGRGCFLLKIHKKDNTKLTFSIKFLNIWPHFRKDFKNFQTEFTCDGFIPNQTKRCRPKFNQL